MIANTPSSNANDTKNIRVCTRKNGKKTHTTDYATATDEWQRKIWIYESRKYILSILTTTKSACLPMLCWCHRKSWAPFIRGYAARVNQTHGWRACVGFVSASIRSAHSTIWNDLNFANALCCITNPFYICISSFFFSLSAFALRRKEANKVKW